MRHQDDYSIRDNYIDNAEHFGHDPLYDYRDQLDEGHVSQGDTSGPDFEYGRLGARGAWKREEFHNDVTGAEDEFWQERRLGDKHQQWKKDTRQAYPPKSWSEVKHNTVTGKRLHQAKSRKKS